MQIRECVRSGPWNDFYVLSEDQDPASEACIMEYCSQGASAANTYVKQDGEWYLSMHGRMTAISSFDHFSNSELDRILEVLLRQESERIILSEEA
jgi:hypothetical protein